MSGESFDAADRPPAAATWEWRAFAARFEVPGLALAERRTDVYLLAPGLPPELGLKLRGGARVEVKRRAGAQGELERWAKELSEPLPLPPFQVRYLTRSLAPGGPRPVRPLPAAADLATLVRDLGLGEPRRVVVEKTIEAGPLGGGAQLQRTRFVARGPGTTVEAESLALDAPDEATLAAARAGLALPADALVRSWPAWLTERFR